MNTTIQERNDDTAKIQARYAQRVRSRLAEPAISILHARDGILDCFLATYYQGIAQGLEGMLDIHGSEDQVLRVTSAIFRRKLREHGSSFENPTVAALIQVKEALDLEMHFNDLPAELKALHDQVCALLISKASGDLPHHGDHSLVAGAANGASAAPAPDPEPDAAGAPTAATSPAPGPRSSHDYAVHSLRQVLSRYLQEIAQETADGAPAASLKAQLKRASSLAQALADFESTKQP